MFLQVIQGRVSDPGSAREALDRWIRELAPGAEGWLGTTAGVTADNMFVMLTRYESSEAARRSSNRHGYHEWWTQTSKILISDIAVHDCAVTSVFRSGGSDGAGFVQVVQGKVADPARPWGSVGRSPESRTSLAPARMALLRAVQLVLVQMDPDYRPDFIGGTAGFDPNDDTLTEAVYFTSESAARAGER